MHDQSTSIIGRLSEVGRPRQSQQWKPNDGYYVSACRVSATDIPQLIDIACKWSDPDWPEEGSDMVGSSENIELLPITAWRTLAELGSSDAVEPLIQMLCGLDFEDDWSAEELPHVFGKIGKPAIAALVRLANDAEKPEFVRKIAADALGRVAVYHSETRNEVVALLTAMMESAAEEDVELNSSVLMQLVDLQAVEAAEAIERAFSKNRLDVAMIGDWEVVRKKLGVEGMRLQMPEHPYNSIAQLRTRLGIGIFSDEPIFDHHGEPDAAAEAAYYERAWNLFSRSKEAEEVINCFGDLSWTQSFLQFGLHYRGEIVDIMTLHTLEEFVFEYVPGKVSTEAKSANSIIVELRKFWKYLDRVFELPAAKSIIDWLHTDNLVQELENELADSSNFGIAKSFVMAGMAAGYDMTSQQGTAAFMATYNTSRQQSASVARSQTILSSPSRVGRNDPCPCGSGKKYKKCCYRS